VQGLHASGGQGQGEAPRESLPIEELKALTTVADIQRQLRILNEEETRIDAELDQILRGRDSVEARLDSLEGLRPQIGLLRNDSQHLYDVIAKTTLLAESISGKVRVLDLEQSRVKSVIALVQDIQDLKDCATGVQQAISANDYEVAGRYIQRFLQFDQASIEKIFLSESQAAAARAAAASSPTDEPVSSALRDAAEVLGPDSSLDAGVDVGADGGEGDGDGGAIGARRSPVRVLRAAQARLTDLMVDEFDRAVREHDEEGILRSVKIFPLLGKGALGLDKHAGYICGIVSRVCQDGMRGVNDRASSAYADLLTRLFEFVASLVDAQEAVIETYYGPGRLMRIIQRLQREADIQSSIILNTFSERKQIQRRLNEVSAFEAAYNRSAQARSEMQVDPREVDGILNELALISQRTQLFQRFLVVRSADQTDKLRLASKGSTTDTDDGAAPPPPPELEGVSLNENSNLIRSVRELMSYYVTFEEYFIRRSVEKAMKIDEHEPGNPTSSSVDDVFYIVKKAISRALSTGDSITVCSLLAIVGRLLESDFVSVFQRKLSGSFASTETKDSRTGFMILLNNIDVTCDHMQRLVKEIDVDMDHQFGSATNEQRMNMKTSLRSLTDYAQNFKKILMTWVENMFNQTIKPRIKSQILQDSYKDIRYVLGEDEYAEQDAADLLVKRMVGAISKMLGVYQKTFTERNYNQTFAHFIDAFVKEWERLILANHKFNQLGALRFDKDVRGLTSYLTSLTQWSLRDKYARLSQIAIIVSLDKVSEIHDTWGAKAGNGVQWRLTANEVRKFLALRIDFKPEEIQKLKL
ncbi:Golgi transport complex subunit 4, partial [Irineochytrium annulatum]